jgi:TrmH family RNA methyltransferase
MEITSLKNPRVRQIVNLRERRTREHEGLMLVEGFYELEVALKSGFQPTSVYIAPELASEELPLGVGCEIVTVSRSVFQKMAYRENPDGWLAVFPTPKSSLEDLNLNSLPFVIVTESIEKPGNLGAILRTADAVGVDGLLVCNPVTDLYNPNVVRASRGAIFTVPTVQTTNSAALSWLQARGIKTIAASPGAESNYYGINLCQPIAIIVGAEDEGLSGFWLDNADTVIRIPMMGKVNSLNVSISTAIIAYEVIRQRSFRDQSTKNT